MFNDEGFVFLVIIFAILFQYKGLQHFVSVGSSKKVNPSPFSQQLSNV